MDGVLSVFLWDEMILSRLGRDIQISLALHSGVWEGLCCLSVC